MTTRETPANTNAAAPADERIGNYRVIRRIARGGMGVVYEAEHTILPRRAAVKVMRPVPTAADDTLHRLVQEAGILETFQHPGVVQVYDCGVLTDGRAWIAMELVVGVSLASWLAIEPQLEVGRLVALLGAVAEILAAAHARGIVHRDLKPDNILIENCGAVRLIDWGIATQNLPGPRLTLGETTLGTPMYMAPEQAQGQRVDGRCDVYALGVVAYEALTSAPPFNAASTVDLMMQHVSAAPRPLRELRPDLSPFLAAVLEQMLAEDPDERPSAVELMTALDYVAGGEPPAAPAPVAATGPVDELGPIGGPPPASGTTSAEADAEAYAELQIDLAPMLPAPRWTPRHLVAARRADRSLMAVPTWPRSARGKDDRDA